MQHEYTDTEMVAAADIAAAQTASTYDAAGLPCLRAFLDALPDQQDGWEYVADILEIRRGDMLKSDTENVVITYKHAVKRVDLSNVIIHFDNDEALFWDDNHAVYRIPAPVQHPDPEQHPVIANVAVHNPGTNLTHRYDYATWDIGEYYDCWGNDGGYYGAWRPRAIVEWSPAKVVAGND